jgi:hypothetical protein
MTIKRGEKEMSRQRERNMRDQSQNRNKTIGCRNSTSTTEQSEIFAEQMIKKVIYTFNM